MFRSVVVLAALVGVAGCTTMGGGVPSAACGAGGAVVAGGQAGCVAGTAAQQRDEMLNRRAAGLGR